MGKSKTWQGRDTARQGAKENESLAEPDVVEPGTAKPQPHPSENENELILATASHFDVRPKQGSATGGDWAKYSASNDVSDFGSQPALSGQSPWSCTQDSLTFDGAAQHEGKEVQDGQILGGARHAITFRPLQDHSSLFGRQSPLKHYSNLLWTPKPTAVTAATIPRRSLDDLYRENPEKQLQGIEQSTIDLTADAVIQITNEATLQWLNKWCPQMDLAKIFDKVESVDAPRKDENQYIVPKEALALKSSTVKVADLFRRCHEIRKECSTFQIVDLVRLLNQCAYLCEALNDRKRRFMLQAAIQSFQWIPLHLDTKKIDIYKQSTTELCDLDRIPVLSSSATSFAVLPSLAERDSQRKVAEIAILDRALERFEEWRAVNRIEWLTKIQVLLDLTSVTKTPRGLQLS